MIIKKIFNFVIFSGISAIVLASHEHLDELPSNQECDAPQNEIPTHDIPFNEIKGIETLKNLGAFFPIIPISDNRRNSRITSGSGTNRISLPFGGGYPIFTKILQRAPLGSLYNSTGLSNSNLSTFFRHGFDESLGNPYLGFNAGKIIDNNEIDRARLKQIVSLWTDSVDPATVARVIDMQLATETKPNTDISENNPNTTSPAEQTNSGVSGNKPDTANPFYGLSVLNYLPIIGIHSGRERQIALKGKPDNEENQDKDQSKERDQEPNIVVQANSGITIIPEISENQGSNADSHVDTSNSNGIPNGNPSGILHPFPNGNPSGILHPFPYGHPQSGHRDIYDPLTGSFLQNPDPVRVNESAFGDLNHLNTSLIDFDPLITLKKKCEHGLQKFHSSPLCLGNIFFPLYSEIAASSVTATAQECILYCADVVLGSIVYAGFGGSSGPWENICRCYKTKPIGIPIYNRYNGSATGLATTAIGINNCEQSFHSSSTTTSTACQSTCTAIVSLYGGGNAIYSHLGTGVTPNCYCYWSIPVDPVVTATAGQVTGPIYPCNAVWPLPCPAAP